MKITKHVKNWIFWQLFGRRLADKILMLMATALLLIALTLTSCKKEPETYCVVCSITTDAPGESQSKSYCGTDEEIANEDVRLKNGCEELEQMYPQYTFECGCD